MYRYKYISDSRITKGRIAILEEDLHKLPDSTLVKAKKQKVIKKYKSKEE